LLKKKLPLKRGSFFMAFGSLKTGIRRKFTGMGKNQIRFSKLFISSGGFLIAVRRVSIGSDTIPIAIGRI
jgi:hypothetical protein